MFGKESSPLYDRSGRVEDPGIAQEMAKAEQPHREKRRWGGLLGPAKEEVAKGVRAAEEVGERLAEVREAGKELARALKEAAAENTVFNVMGGKPQEGYDPIRVDVMQDQAGEFSVRAYTSSEQAQSGFPGRGPRIDYPIVFIKISSKAPPDKEIHVFFGAFGPSEDYPLSDPTPARTSATEEVRHFRLFPENDGRKRKV